jgi:hypothetical protein
VQNLTSAYAKGLAIAVTLAGTPDHFNAHHEVLTEKGQPRRTRPWVSGVLCCCGGDADEVRDVGGSYV